MNLLVTLLGKRIRLRPLNASDAQALVKAAEDGQLWNLPFTVIPSEESVEQYIETAIQGRNAGSVIPFVVEDMGTN